MDLQLIFQNLVIMTLLISVQVLSGSRSSSLTFEDDDEDMPPWGRCPWIKNKLKNGRVKIRSRGRIAKFLCNPGYELAGKRFATCVRGQWNNPLPVCVARGCSKLPEIANGRVTEMYRGALLVYDCLPGYTLDGVISVYCDGRRWSTDSPRCVVAISDPKMSCDFEDPDLCGWTHDPTHDFDWRRNQFSTPSGHVGTGPSFDHTFGKGKGGFYLYEEASSPRKQNDTSRLFSPVYPSGSSGGCFIFWYHMYGATTGGLRIYIKPESHVFGEVPPSWEKFGDQGNHWLRGNVSVPVLPENFQIIIEGIRGSNYIGDTAIDDVNLTAADCETVGNDTESIAESATDSCRGRCRESNEPSSACSCNGYCIGSGTCCNDYLTICTTPGNETSESENTEEYLTPVPNEFPAITMPPTFILPDAKNATIKYLQTEEYAKSSLLTTTSFNPTRVSSETSTRLASTMPTAATERQSPESSRTQYALSPTVPSSTIKPTLSSTHETEKVTASSLSSSVKVSTLFLSSTVKVSALSTSSTVSETAPTISSTVNETAPSISSTVNNTSPPVSSASSLSSSSILSSTVTQTSPLSAVASKTTIPVQVNFTKLVETTSSITSSPVETRRTYNLRPRNRTSTAAPTVPASTAISITNSPSSSQTTNASSYAIISNISTSTVSSSQSTSNRSSTYNLASSNTGFARTSAVDVTRNASTIATEMKNNTVRSSIMMSTSTTMSFQYVTTKSSKIKQFSVPITTTTTTQTTKPTMITEASTRLLTTSPQQFINITTKATKYGISLSTSSLSKLDRSTSGTEISEKFSSKSESTASNGSQPTVTIVSVSIVIIICVVGGVLYFIRRRNFRRQSKLSDDSEMRFLSDNEVMEYSDPAALGRILIN